jgi:hypothetical protein
MSLAEQAHTSGNRIKWWNRNRTIATATGTFNPLLAGSNAARPTANLVVEMKALRVIVAPFLFLPVPTYLRTAFHS